MTGWNCAVRFISLISWVMCAFFVSSCDNSRLNERSAGVWSEDAAYVYTTTAKNVGIGVKNPSAPFSVFRNGLNMSATGFAVAAFDPKNPDKGVWLGYDASGVIGIIGADSDGKTASHLAFWTHDGRSHTEKARLTSSGNFGLGTSLPDEKVHIIGNLRVQGSSDCVLGNSSGGVSCSSDGQLKDNARPIEGALEKVLSLRGVEFDWNALSQSPGRHDIGLIAQEVENVFPTAVREGADGHKMLDHAVLVAPIVEAVKEIHKHGVEIQDKEILALKEQNALLTRELEAVKAWVCAKDPSAVWCGNKK